MKLSINFSDQQYLEIKELAKEGNKSITDWIISNLPISQQNKLVLQEIENRVSKLPPRDFSIPDLFSKEEWVKFTVGSRLVEPKQFYKKVLNSMIPNVTFIGKTSANLALYSKE